MKTKVNFLYEFLTPNGYLPLGYQLKDIPILFSEINDGLVDMDDVTLRMIDNSSFRISKTTLDIFHLISEYVSNTDRVLVHNLSNEQLENDINIFAIASTFDQTIVDYISRVDLDNILSKKSFKLLKNYDSVKVLFIDDKEGCLEYSDDFFRNIYNFVEKHKISNKKVVFVTNTSNIKQIYDNYLRKYNLTSFMLCESINFFVEGEPGKNILKYESMTNNYEVNNVIERNIKYSLDVKPISHTRNKHFLCLNRNSNRLHRPRMILNLIERGLFDKGLISLLRSTEFDDFCEVPENIEYKLKIKEKYPFVIDYEDATEVANMHNYFTEKDMWNDTYFSVVNETGVSGGAIFITEKTIRPMIYFHPFIVYGNPNTLSELRKLGFETFPEFFDESYDTIENEVERLSMILNNVERVCNLSIEELHRLYNSVQGKLLHNRNLLTDFFINGSIKNKFLQTINV